MILIFASGMGWSVLCFANRVINDIYIYPEDLLSPENSSQKSPTSPTSQNNSDLKVYTNSDFHFSLQIPKTWKTEEGEDISKNPAQKFFQFQSLDFTRSQSLNQKIAKGYQLVVRILPSGIFEGYTENSNDFQQVKTIKISDFEATEFLVSNPDAVENLAPVQIKFIGNQKLVLIDGWFRSLDQKEFLNLFEKIAQTFKFLN